jgi:hypothetical protein
VADAGDVAAAGAGSGTNNDPLRKPLTVHHTNQPITTLASAKLAKASTSKAN